MEKSLISSVIFAECQMTESCLASRMEHLKEGDQQESGSGFMPICQNQTQGLFKDFQRPYKGYI